MGTIELLNPREEVSLGHPKLKPTDPNPSLKNSLEALCPQHLHSPTGTSLPPSQCPRSHDEYMVSIRKRYDNSNERHRESKEGSRAWPGPPISGLHGPICGRPWNKVDPHEAPYVTLMSTPSSDRSPPHQGRCITCHSGPYLDVLFQACSSVSRTSPCSPAPDLLASAGADFSRKLSRTWTV